MSAEFYFVSGFVFGVVVSILGMFAAHALIDAIDSKEVDK